MAPGTIGYPPGNGSSISHRLKGVELVIWKYPAILENTNNMRVVMLPQPKMDNGMFEAMMMINTYNKKGDMNLGKHSEMKRTDL